jgi:hypothetical protein
MIKEKGPMMATVLTRELRDLGFTKDDAIMIRDKLRTAGKTVEWKGGKPNKVLIGTPDAIAKLKDRFASPADVILEQPENKS